MLSKFICAAMLAASGASAHSIQTRQAPQSAQPQPYYKVNRDSEYGAPSAPSYSAPAPSYSAPAPAYEAPAPSYSAPAAPSYSAPEASYGAPSTGYGDPYAEEEAGLDLTSIIIPLLALVGLSLLFPTYVSLTTVRKRREAGDLEQDTSSDVIDRVNEIYTAVVQSEECMEKIACEVGALAGDVGLTRSPALKLAGGFMPKKYKTYYSQFINGKDCNKIKCGTFA